MNTFQTWVDLPEGRAALLAVQRVVECVARSRKRRVINPLFLHGPAGSGKSHLTAALVAETIRRCPGLIASVLPASDLTPLVQADAVGESAGVLAQLRACDLLIVEDVQHLAPSAIEPLVGLLDARVSRQRQTLITAVVGPGRLTQFPARLTSRLASGLVVGLTPLSRQGRRSYLQERAKAQSIAVGKDVLHWLADAIGGSARQLDGALRRVVMLARLGGHPPELAAVQAAFQEDAESRRLTVEQIARRVGHEFQVDPRKLQARDRSRHVLLPRQVGMYLARKLTQMSLQQIGAYFGGRDHTTVLHACQKVEQAIDCDPSLSGVVRQLHADLM